MKYDRKYILILVVLICSCLNVNAQSNSKLKEFQDINDLIKSSDIKNIIEREQLELGVNDSIFKLFDVDIDITLGEISLDMSWGDPVKNPKIRCNRASNLYGRVRHNADGSLKWHRGFDYYAPVGTAVYSVGDGVVSLVQKHPDYGLCVLVTHKRPKITYYTLYAHLNSIDVEYGEKVKRGAVLGKSGKTGNAYNLSGEEVHLHFECRTSPKHGDRKQVNPNVVLKTKFYSADPKNKWQANVGVVKKGGQSLFE